MFNDTLEKKKEKKTERLPSNQISSFFVCSIASSSKGPLNDGHIRVCVQLASIRPVPKTP